MAPEIHGISMTNSGRFIPVLANLRQWAALIVVVIIGPHAVEAALGAPVTLAVAHERCSSGTIGSGADVGRQHDAPLALKSRNATLNHRLAVPPVW